MDKIYQLVDISINRAAEGFRILEDYCRYRDGLKGTALAFKEMRRELRCMAEPLSKRLISARRAGSDPGPQLSVAMKQEGNPPGRNAADINAMRVQEALRALEEYLKVLGEVPLAQNCERMRFETYTLQQQCAMKTLKHQRIAALASDLYGITAESWSGGRSNQETVSAMLTGGIRIIQYREKNKSMLEKYRECTMLRKLTADAGALFIINDHADLAAAVDADGVHIGQDDMPPEIVRGVIGEERLLGISTHSPAQARKAVKEGADYIGVGPLYSTRTKADVCDPVGLEYLDYAVKHIRIPIVAIGGIKRHNIDEVIGRGASCVSLVTEIVGAADPVACIQELRKIIQGGKENDCI